MNAQAMRKMRGAVFVAAAVAATSAFADGGEGPRYTYVGVGYERINPDKVDDDANAGAIEGSLAVAEHVHLFAGYSYGEVDTAGITIELESAEGGAGLNIPLTKTVDVVADVAYLWSKVSADRFGSDKEDGFGARLGLRAMVTPKLELNAGATYTDVSSGEWGGYAGIAYNFTDAFAVTADVSAGQDVTSYGAGVRFYLGAK